MAFASSADRVGVRIDRDGYTGHGTGPLPGRAG
jgi:hypothetical protein